MSTRTRPQRDGAGFTLVELLIVISLMGIIMGALVMSLQVMMAQTAASQTRVEVSHDAQLAAAYFADDVASMGARDTNAPPGLMKSVEVGVAPTSGTHRCGSAIPSAAPVVRMAWDELTDGATEVRTRVVVSYAVVTAPGGERQLHRVECRGGTSATSDTVVAHNVSATTLPSVTCSSTCDDAAPPQRVKLVLTIQKPNNLGPDDELAVTLTGQRRQT